MSEIISEVISILEKPVESSFNTCSEELKSHNFEEGRNPLNNYRQASNDSLSMDNYVSKIAPGGYKELKSILLNEKCDEKEFLSLSPNATFGYSCKR